MPRIRLKSECVPLQQLETDSTSVDVQVTTKTPSPTLVDRYPPVSIIKPLCGVDPNLATNLETFFTMNYPRYELLFCVHTHDDPAVYIVNSLLAKFPHVDARLFTGGESVGVNPKVNNMMPAYRAAKYQLLLISDAGIMSMLLLCVLAPKKRTLLQCNQILSMIWSRRCSLMWRL